LFLPVIYWLTIIFLLPPIFDKYKLELKQSVRLENTSQIFNIELDGDGHSEQIHLMDNHIGKPLVYIRNHSGKTISQWNLKVHC